MAQLRIPLSSSTPAAASLFCHPLGAVSSSTHIDSLRLLSKGSLKSTVGYDGTPGLQPQQQRRCPYIYICTYPCMHMLRIVVCGSYTFVLRVIIIWGGCPSKSSTQSKTSSFTQQNSRGNNAQVQAGSMQAKFARQKSISISGYAQEFFTHGNTADRKTKQ